MQIIKLRDHEEKLEQAANWFHHKWEIPLSAYQESMEACLHGSETIPQWYVMIHESEIIAGLGIIENDFHNRKDLSPNICALYVEKDFRRQGIAEKLLQEACDDMKTQGIHKLYLVTNHTHLYERYDWEFIGFVQAEDEDERLRMYSYQT
ncbi:GNAT family N-acetyltransferase [Lactococcus garvieae subsp. garvieae]|uniref:GNAT family N-acetyltransferase n=1 Tax=Lactococcus garvieae TaxID=1363 RepID=UPI0005A6567D|nr:GNAT family N-acetyltransferase [Lactococcus garvieae]KAA8713171.1 GNAT family N-acetyltransferase [Lactococcus garvieae subsp. garvieae]MDG6192331.1 GNAT family N-acetyltransferase [Lactococcus garvieae]QPR48293.1 GNAT family N-acetyltransferase [Lactococcus garvieae]